MPIYTYVWCDSVFRVRSMAKTFAFASPRRIRIQLFASPFNHELISYLIGTILVSQHYYPAHHMFRAVVPSFQLSFSIVFTFWTQLRYIAITWPKLRATGRHAGIMSPCFIYLHCHSYVLCHGSFCSSCPLVLYSHA